jgi:DNA-binding response OmpR family regulator
MASILLVDSDATLRAAFAEALRPLGEVVAAPTGADGLRLLATRRFDLILLEPKLPLIDGFMILRMLVSRPGPNKGVPLLVVTSDTSEDMRARAMAEHARFVLTKPVSMETLFALCDATLHRPAPAAPGSPAEPPEPDADAKEEPDA